MAAICVVIVSMSSPAKATSDGYPWTLRTAPSGSSLMGVTYGNGTFVAVGDSVVMVSTDGINWQSATPAGASGWRDVAYGPDGFVAVAASGVTRVMTSPDGITWTGRSIPSTNTWMSVTYGGGQYVTVGSGGTAAEQVMTSPDGVTWTARTSAGALIWDEIAYGAGVFVAGAGSFSDTGQGTMYSTDGVTWIRGAHPVMKGVGALTYGNGKFVGMSMGGGGYVISSTDGITWTTRASGFGSQWFGIVYGNGVYVAVTPSGTTATGNPAATSWSGWATPASSSWRSVAYGEGLFVAVGDNTSNQIMTTGTYSPQAVTWNPSNTTADVLSSPLTPDALATRTPSDGGAISYSVSSAGTTGCTVNAATGVVAFTAAGTCQVSAVAAAVSEAYASSSTTRSFVISRVTQAVSWSPTNTSVTASSGTIVPSALATTNGDGAISYAVTSAGTTGCSVNASTGVIAFTGAGTCQVTATAAETATYSQATRAVNFTITAPVVAGGSSSSSPASSSSPTSGGALQEITEVRPASGSVAGGNQVAIIGYGFTGATSVTVGGKAATFTVINDAHVDVTIPTGERAGAADVAVVLSPARGRAFAPGGYVYTSVVGASNVAAPAISNAAAPVAVSAVSATSRPALVTIAGHRATVTPPSGAVSTVVQRKSGSRWSTIRRLESKASLNLAQGTYRVVSKTKAGAVSYRGFSIK